MILLGLTSITKKELFWLPVWNGQISLGLKNGLSQFKLFVNAPSLCVFFVYFECRRILLNKPKVTIFETEANRIHCKKGEFLIEGKMPTALNPSVYDLPKGFMSIRHLIDTLREISRNTKVKLFLIHIIDIVRKVSFQRFSVISCSQNKPRLLMGSDLFRKIQLSVPTIYVVFLLLRLKPEKLCVNDDFNFWLTSWTPQSSINDDFTLFPIKFYVSDWNFRLT